MNETKSKIAACWLASCGGCDVGLLGLHERLFDLLEFGDFVFWPAALDFKYEDLKDYKSGEIDLVFLNGGIKTSENEKIARILREKAEILVAYGTCAHQGGLPGLQNLLGNSELLTTVYLDNPTTKNPKGTLPKPTTEKDGFNLELPELQERVRDLSAVVKVDYTIPGCPPPPSLTEKFLDLVLEEEIPENGTVIAGEKSVCEDCSREWGQETIGELHRLTEFQIDPQKCMLDQGIVCLGPVTRSGCEGACPEANLPCKGCFGPAPEVEDQGIEMLNSLASVVQIGPEGQALEEEAKLLRSLPDPIGTFFGYSLARSIFSGQVEEEASNERKANNNRPDYPT